MTLSGDDPRRVRHPGLVEVPGQTLVQLDNAVVVDAALVAVLNPPTVSYPVIALQLDGTVEPDHDPITVLIMLGPAGARSLIAAAKMGLDGVNGRVTIPAPRRRWWHRRP